MEKYSWKKTLRVWPTDHVMKRSLWISYLNRNQELFFTITEEGSQRQFRIISAVSLVSKWRTMVLFSIDWMALSKVMGEGPCSALEPNPCSSNCGDRTTTSVGRKGGAFTTRACRADHWVKENYSWALSSHGFRLLSVDFLGIDYSFPLS